FAIDEIGDADEKQSGYADGGDHVEKRPHGNAPLAGEQDHGDRGAGDATVEGHAALPDLEDPCGLVQIGRQVIEQDEADAAAHDDAYRRPEYEIVDIGQHHRRRV